MWGLKIKGVVLLSGASLLAFSGLALAQEQSEDDPQDELEETILNVGYDEEFHLFVWNTSATKDQYDCSLENGPVYPAYLVTDDVVTVGGLTSGTEGEEAEVTFPDREDEAEDPLPYTADGDCALEAAEVAGPNGQINHGMFMKLFNSLYDGRGRGCLNRYLAQSDLGKGDQQIEVSDVDPEFVSVMNEDTGEIEFSTFAADCERSNRGNGNGYGSSDGKQNGHGKRNGHGGQEADEDEPDPEPSGGDKSDSPGRSGDAPGHNK